MLIFFSTMICILSLIFSFLNHPLTLGLILLINTILISLTTGMMNYNFWFSYILFLIMIGGMLILFIYMTSVASNEKFKFSSKMFNFLMFMIFLMMMVILLVDQYYCSFYMNMLDMMNQNMLKNNSLSMNKYMNFPNNLIIYMMIIYLLITLIMIVKITELHYGPLRQKF
uniref:NADH-ubiquinone oxidoreductase chain 6 n=1 Tax=Chrysomelidae sp. SPH01 TaxID=1213606 RepID=A0A0S2MPY6_9CUCU|nr:NADH deshydrogenase subunit 6 [Chrysomelidae sp. SPH01]